MVNMGNYIRQHKEISDVILNIKKLLNRDIENNSKEIALLINNLAGKLKIHLAMEDKYLYPSLKEVLSKKEIAIKFEKEMGDISTVFTEFKNKYNTADKIITNISSFKTEISKIVNALEKRLTKEETELYPN
ncbi:MAG: hemerythrin domain-containing protein [Fusobacteriaceae bacterium]|nr:hemerythrin domain-containing protein [Fusobacteriaceae bacterium]MBN2838909.1 hemerythrin domain-containing protein [Fusobacteriaceae bacterium]